MHLGVILSYLVFLFHFSGAHDSFSDVPIDEDVEIPMDDPEDAGNYSLMDKMINTDLVSFNDEVKDIIIPSFEIPKSISPQVEKVLNKSTPFLRSSNIRYPYKETGNITNLEQGYLLGSFNFKQNSSWFREYNSLDQEDNYYNFDLFPKFIINMMQDFKMSQFNMKVTSGNWNTELWGLLPFDNFKPCESAKSIVETWASLESSSREAADEAWKTAVGELNERFSLYLNGDNDSTNLITTDFSKQQLKNKVLKSNNLFYVNHLTFPTMSMDRSNLKYFINLLPNKNKNGISKLLSDIADYDLNWHNIILGVEKNCDDITGICKYNLEMDIDVVLDFRKVY
ncbi:hypothetical protein Kpol_513p14 [Vanderwaltozyma polyspora DSM 70294]|uniref:Uncharacterized protein n=1 Tax=Vanderwaltozyma polyspora (strain ATCC 22028 / DSM 70294 / BCRC 21397 / CBS 2163 / NBRC 10782 / NRRL Y-8283 / UCD 57-17) TaxID=436907 RepID=A7TMK0_VANPO|nr:uncharacterized protein Kpol_513p14 [Vanderwaltozyma polyspora DSM 70294]EDO16498.1 hypothetical protein Kpol_513p14 [Vanderwaltozyma polyspora DSM 70294]